MRIVHDHARALAARLPEPSEVAPAPPVDAAPEAVRLAPLDTSVLGLRSPWQSAHRTDPAHAPLLAALHARVTAAAAQEPSDELRAALRMTTLLGELDAMAARVRAEQRGWLRA